MSRFKHAPVMGLIGVCLDAGSASYIVMPYMANGSLFPYLKSEGTLSLMRAQTKMRWVTTCLKKHIELCHQLFVEVSSEYLNFQCTILLVAVGTQVLPKFGK